MSVLRSTLSGRLRSSSAGQAARLNVQSTYSPVNLYIPLPKSRQYSEKPGAAPMASLSRDVLIIGAGPTGLTAAIALALQGVSVEVWEKNHSASPSTRASAVHARTLELYAKLGIQDAIISAGYKITGMNYWFAGYKQAHMDFGFAAQNSTLHPYILSIPQRTHELILIERCRDLNIPIRRSTTLTSFEETGGYVHARGEHRSPQTASDGFVEWVVSSSSLVHAKYMIGADGAHSFVRSSLGIDFPGISYPHLFLNIDGRASGSPVDGETQTYLDGPAFATILPFGENNIRLIRILDPHSAETSSVFENMYRRLDDGDGRDKPVLPVPHPSFGAQINESNVLHGRIAEGTGVDLPAILADAESRLGLHFDNIENFSVYRVSARKAAAFRQGRVFLAGDAAHIHSPAGGQGLNTGVGDAINLSWKIGAVLRSPGTEGLNDGLLESYCREREAFASNVLCTTDAMFVRFTAEGFRATLARALFVGVGLRWITAWAGLARRWIMGINQTGWAYGASTSILTCADAGYPAAFAAGTSTSDTASASAGTQFSLKREFLRAADQFRLRGARIKAGDRMPPIQLGNDAAPHGLHWSVFVFGDGVWVPGGLETWCRDAGVPLVNSVWETRLRDVGIARGTAYLVRPDGYVSVVGGVQELNRFAEGLGLSLS